MELANLRPSPPPVQQVLEQEPSTFKLRDGGGIISTADWFQPQEADLGSAVRQQWWQRIQEWDLVQRLDAHVQARARTPWLNKEEGTPAEPGLAGSFSDAGLTQVSPIIVLWPGLACPKIGRGVRPQCWSL